VSVRMATSSPLAFTKPVSFEPETMPSVSVVASTVQTWEGDLLLVAVHEDDFTTEAEVTSIKSEVLQALDKDMAGALAESVSAGGFEGKQGTQSKVVRVGTAPNTRAKYVGLLGLGKADKVSGSAEWGQSAFQSLGGAIATLAKANKSKSVGLAFATPLAAELHSPAVSQVAAGALLGGYETSRFKSKKSPTASKLEALHLLLPSLEAAAGEAAVAKAKGIAAGTFLARYLVEAPPNVCTPTHLAEAAQHIAARSPSVMKVEVLDKAQCMEMGMGLYLGVAEASDEPPKFIHLTYSPPGGATRKVALVGKGLTFDSGGYNLKAGPGSMIEMMKFDMGGAAATLGAARIIAELQPAGVEIHFIVAACENMVSGRSLRPGDILTGASGKTVEVNNTDAEGRLTLADALWFAQEKCGATSVVDTATLTGAIMISLGTEIAGLFTPSDALAASLTAASKAAGEKVWRMPMENNYFDMLKSPVADMKNTGARYGGSITAALFLKQFIKEGVEWAHLDIAGTVWDEKAGLPTGWGAATLAEWAAGQGKSA